MDEQIQLSGEQLSEPITQEKIMDNSAEVVAKIEEKNEADNGSNEGSLGKFKDTQSLLKAYNNLQAEFTKKCQAISEMKSKIENDEEKNSLPIYHRQDWAERVGLFLEKNKEAQPFAKQIAETILKDENLAKNESALEIAFAKIASSNYISPQKVIEDENFVENYVLNNDKIKKAVLNLYIKDISSKKSPSVIGSKAGTSQVLYKTPSANTLSEAKQIVKQMLDWFRRNYGYTFRRR